MDDPARPAPTPSTGALTGAATGDATVALPPPPFLRPAVDGDAPRFVPVSPRVVVLIAAAAVLGLVLWMARDSLRPFIVGLLLVYLLDGPINRLARRGVRRPLAILIVYVIALVAFVAFMAITLTPLINEILRFAADFPHLAEQLNQRIQDLSDYYSHLQIPPAIRDWIDSLIAGLQNGQPGAGLNLALLLPLITGAGSLIGAIFGYVILPVWVFYLLKDRAALVNAFDRALPASWRFDTWVLLRTVERVFGQWVRGQLVLGFAVGVLTFVGLIILSRTVDPIFGRYAILLSVIAGVLELLPIIGPIISAVPAVLLAATVGIEAVVAALVLYTLVQQIENNFLVPKIQGDATDLHPAAVMFAIIMGGALAGLLGAILALPIAAAGRDVFRYLFRRMSPDDPEALAALVAKVGATPVDG